MPVINKVEEKIEQLKDTFELIPNERKELLNQFADYISNKLKKGKEVNLIFICTHNSRRSHISQIWAQAAAEYFNITNIECYSGGTEATAFNPRAIEALMKTGFNIGKKDNSDNPIYLVNYSEENEPIECFSKVYSDPYNPQKDFAAVITCSEADENCPTIFGAEARFPIRYEDPKEFDDTEMEKQMYLQRVDQIGREMLFLFSIM